MTDFRFIPVRPHPALSPYIAKMCVFESNGRLPAMDKKLIVPNANFKLTLTYRNGIVASIGNKTFIQPENKLSLTGLIDAPVVLDSQEDVQTGTIIVEFNPLGAYRLIRLSYAAVKNQIVELEDVVGNAAAQLNTQLTDAVSLNLKLHILQNFLIKQLGKGSADAIYDYCISRISASKGLISVAQLEKETGYSARWLHTKFQEHLGTGPKNLAEIVRFKQIYHAFSSGTGYQNLKNQIYLNYHDQSHFIRAFKRFTGSTPTELQNSMNQLSIKNFTT